MNAGVIMLWSPSIMLKNQVTRLFTLCKRCVGSLFTLWKNIPERVIFYFLRCLFSYLLEVWKIAPSPCFPPSPVYFLVSHFPRHLRSPGRRDPPPASHVPSVSPRKPWRFEIKLEEIQLLWFFSFVNRFDKTEWEEPKNGCEESWLPFPDLPWSCWRHGQVPSPFCFLECKMKDEDDLGV